MLVGFVVLPIDVLWSAHHPQRLSVLFLQALVSIPAPMGYGCRHNVQS